MFYRGYPDVRLKWIIRWIWGPPVLDASITSEQWAAMEAAMSSVIKPKSSTLSPAKVAQVKQRCNKFPPMLQPSSFTSSNDIITAILGISVDRVQHPTRAINNENASVTMTVDRRSRVQPPLPNTYVGNMAFLVRSDIYPTRDRQIPVENAQEADILRLIQLALQLRSKLASLNEALAYSVSAQVANQEDWCGLEEKPGDVIVTSWRHLKTFSLDFGEELGKIIDFEAGIALMPGACIVMPSRAQGDGSKEESATPWEVCITMKPDDFGILMDDPLFRNIVA